MSKFLDSTGVSHLWSKIADYVAGRSVAWENVTGKPDVALRSDLSSVYRYRGSVTNYASLPAEGNTVGDVWNVEASGMNYAWDGEKWDALGEAFQIESISNEEIDAIVSAS